jgi:hypothetical protein
MGGARTGWPMQPFPAGVPKDAALVIDMEQ